MESGELVSLSMDGDAVRLVLKRPPLNFLSLELLRQMEAHLDSLGDDPPGRVLVIDSETTAFCAGLDMAEHTRQGVFLLLEQFHRVLRMLNAFPNPTLAVVRGVALGAGNELLACCDFVLAGERATFGQPEIKVGNIPSVASLLLPPLVGQRRALELVLTGELIPAKDAERNGLINRTLPEEQLDGAVEEIVRGIAATSKAVVSIALYAARGPRTREMENHLREASALYLNRLVDLEDSEEGVRAFLERRVPSWKNG